MNDLPPDWLTTPPDWLLSPVDTVVETYGVSVAAGCTVLLLAKITKDASQWAWNHREEIVDKMRRVKSRTVQTVQGGFTPLEGQSFGATATVGTLTVTSEVTALWDVHANVGSERTASWNVEAPTPSLARRLEELASWYMHVS